MAAENSSVIATPPNGNKVLFWFQFLWALALIAHCDSRGYFGLEIIVTGLGFWFLIARNPYVFVVMCAVQICSVWQQMPLPDNHWVYAGFVSLFAAIATLQSLHPGGKPIAPYLQGIKIVTLLMYGFAVLHKLNWDFFNPDVSCAIVHGETILGRYGYMDLNDNWLAAIGSPVIYLVLGAEAMIPVLLLHPRTWRWGIALGVLFHLSTHMRNFGSLVFASYLLFIPPRVLFPWLDQVERRCRQWLRFSLLDVLTVQAVAFSILHLAAKNRLIPVSTIGWSVQLWMILVCLALAVWLWQTHDWKAPAGPAATVGWGLKIVLVVFALNGLSPYLGLKNGTSLAMWSNLNATTDFGNHIFMPDLKVFPYVDAPQSLRQMAADSPNNYLIKKLVSVNRPLPRPELCRW